MWKQLLTPTLLVAGLWLVVSPTTTYFIFSLDQSYQDALTRNLAAMHAASEIRENVWRLLSAPNADESSPAPIDSDRTDALRRMQQAIVQLRGLAVSPKEVQLVQLLENQWREFEVQLQDLDQSRSGRTGFRRTSERGRQARAISNTATEIRLENERRWRLARQENEHWKGIVHISRLVIVVVGPAIALALGWYLSRRVHQSISQIRIILRNAGAEGEQDVANLEVDAGEALGDLRERVERVIDRVRKANEEVIAARHETLRSERLAAVGELAAGVAHELRNPLTSVKLLLQNAAQRPGDTRLSDDETSVMYDEISRMEATIQGLLDFASTSAPKRRVHDLRSTIQRGLNLVQGRARQREVLLESRLGDEPLWVDGDPDQLHQVCVNLLINGIEACGDSSLTIDAWQDPQVKRIQVQFRDQGPGIPEEILEHLFEPFVTTKEHGTGLGLAICRRIITAHDGAITGRNHPQGGAVISVDLPAVAQPVVQRPVISGERVRVAAAS